MASSIIEYRKKYLDVNDNVLLLTLFYIKESSNYLNEKPEWFLSYIEEVIDVVIDSKPIGWGYMDLDEYITDDKKYSYFSDVLNNCKKFILDKNQKYVDNQIITTILHEGTKNHQTQLILTNLLLDFIDDLILLIDPKVTGDHVRLMKIND
jgi:hypothetical protein